MNRYFLPVVLLMLTLLPGLAATGDIDYQKIFSFAKPDCLKQVEVRRNLSVSLTGWPDLHPGTCLKMEFERYESGKERWPAVIWRTPAIPADWSAAEAISFDVYAVKKGVLRLHFAGDQTARQQLIPVPAGRSRVRVPFVEGTFNYGAMKQLHLLMEDPKDSYIFYIGDLELEQRNFRKLYNALRWEIAKTLAATTADFPKKAELLAALRKSEHELLATLPSKSPRLVSCWNNYREAATALLFAIQEEEITLLTGQKKVQLLFAGSMEKVHQKDNFFLDLPSKQGEIVLAGNEVEAVQLLVRSPEKLSGVSVSWSSVPVNVSGVKLPVAALSVLPVGYVQCDKPCYAVSRSGLWPDPLLDYAKTVDIPAHAWQSFWVEAALPARQTPGVYRGQLTVKSKDTVLGELPITIQVWNFSLPEGIPYQNVFSLPNESLLENPFVKQAPGKWWKECSGLLLSHRANPTTLYGWQPPTTKEAGEWMKHGMLSFNIRYGIGKGEKGLNDYIFSLKQAYAGYEKAGIADKAYCYVYDEAQVSRFPEMRNVLSRVRQAVPQARFLTTAYDDTLGLNSPLGGVIDMQCPLLPNYEILMPEIAKARQHGTQVWCYVACTPNLPYPNFLIEYPSLCMRLLAGGMIWKYRPDGFLYYSSALWLAKSHREVLWSRPPMDGAPVTNWNGRSFGNYNGDGILIYPGKEGPVATLRLKQIRDGIEDYWYFELLRRALEHSGKMPTDWQASARKELQIEPDLIRSMTDYAQDPRILQRKRARVASLLEEYYR